MHFSASGRYENLEVYLVHWIDVHTRLLILSKKSLLHSLILVWMFIDFEKNSPLHVYFTLCERPDFYFGLHIYCFLRIFASGLIRPTRLFGTPEFAVVQGFDGTIFLVKIWRGETCPSGSGGPAFCNSRHASPGNLGTQLFSCINIFAWFSKLILNCAVGLEEKLDKVHSFFCHEQRE